MMKRLFILMLILMPVCSKAGLLPDYSALEKQDHPRLVADSKDFRRHVAEISKGTPVLLKLHEAQMELADSYAADETLPEYSSDMLPVARKALAQIFACAYAWRFTGYKQYLSRAQKIMETVCSFPDWGERNFRAVSEMSLAVSIGYDWLYKGLSSSVRKRVEENLTDVISRSYDVLDLSMATCRGQVARSAMLCTAVAVYDKCPAVAEKLTASILSCSARTIPELYLSDGRHVDGEADWTMGTMFSIVQNMTLSAAFGSDFGLSDFEGWRNAPVYITSVIKKTARPELWYFASVYDDPSLAWTEYERVSASRKPKMSNRLMPSFLLCASRIDMASMKKPAPVPTASDNILGKLCKKTVQEVNNDLHIGCEALDRDYADYDAYKEYLSQLGMKYARLQAGWAKTEKVKGVYDFAWLDHIIDDVVSRGIEPWLQTSYGNTLYEGGGTPYIDGGWPRSEEALHAWDAWVSALAQRYKGKVHVWEIWNEPDELLSPYLGKIDGVHRYKEMKREDFDSLMDLMIRTAEIIKNVDPDAEIAALGLARLDVSLFEEIVVAFKAAGKDDLFDYITYHGYKYRPEDMYPAVEKMQQVLDRHDVAIRLWQGETGAPSKSNSGGALRAYDWSETSQAKWNLRRILGDRARSIRTGIFTLVEHNYAKTKNAKGLLETDKNNKVVVEKKAYHALRNLVSVYDRLDETISFLSVDIRHQKPSSSWIFKDKETGAVSVVLWDDSGRPSDNESPDFVDVVMTAPLLRDPVCVDLLTGDIYRIGMTSESGGVTMSGVPYYDSPVLIVERSAVQWN